MAYPFFYGIRKLARVEFVETRSIKDSNHKSDLLHFFFAFFLHLPFAQLIQTLLFGQFFGRYDF